MSIDKANPSSVGSLLSAGTASSPISVSFTPVARVARGADGVTQVSGTFEGVTLPPHMTARARIPSAPSQATLPAASLADAAQATPVTSAITAPERSSIKADDDFVSFDGTLPQGVLFAPALTHEVGARIRAA